MAYVLPYQLTYKGTGWLGPYITGTIQVDDEILLNQLGLEAVRIGEIDSYSIEPQFKEIEPETLIGKQVLQNKKAIWKQSTNGSIFTAFWQ